MVSTLPPSDVALLVVLICMRKMKLSLADSLGLTSFIADIVLAENICRQYINFDRFLSGLQHLVSPASFASIREALSFHDVDTLFDMFNTVSCLFIDDPHVSPNEATAVSLIKRDSLVGVYIRKLVVKWNSLSFICIGEVLENYIKYCSCGLTDVRQSNVQCEAYVDTGVESMSHLVAAEKAMLRNDTFSALTNIHNFFDDFDTIQTGLCKLSAAVTTSAHPVIRQQEAMLSLATMWIQNKQFPQAIIATEEGMRMAHQLGDHASVARALLLLHHVAERLQPEGAVEGVGAPSAQSVLVRCIQRCTALNLRALEAQATLLLVRLRAQGPLEYKLSQACLSGGISSIEEEYEQYRATSSKFCKYFATSLRCSQVSPADLWALLSSTFLTESLYAPHAFASAQPWSRGVSGQQISDRSGSVLGSMDLMAHAEIVSVDLWRRLGICSMAALSCKRALRRGVFLSPELLHHLSSSLSDIRSKSLENGAMMTLCHMIHVVHVQSENHDKRKLDMSRRCEQASKLLLAAMRFFVPFDISLSSVSPQMVQSSLRLVQIRSTLYSTASAAVDERVLKSLLRMAQHAVHDLSKECKQRHFMYADASMLQCFLLSFFGKKLAVQAITTFQNEVLHSSVLVCECKVLRAVTDLLLEPRQVPFGLASLHDAFEWSSREYAPQCDAALCVLVDLLNRSAPATLLLSSAM